MYKMIVSDLDESLLRTDGHVSPADVATIAKLREMGVKFVPNTGRGFASVQALLKTIGTYGLAGQYVIAYNGGAIVENAGNTVLASTALDFAAADQLFRLAAAHPDLGAHIYTLNHVYVFRPTADEKVYLANRGVDYLGWTDPNLAALCGQQVIKVIFEHPKLEARQAFAAEVARVMGDVFTVSYSSGRYVEFNPTGIDKGNAAIALGKQIGIAPDEIIALGDNLNDLAMIKKVGLGVSVANGVPQVQAAADLVLSVDNDHDPVTALFQRVFA
ncbi:Cof-type HAD-IIB family hydrolase [Lacticaseibacillus sp. GG6-2]